MKKLLAGGCAILAIAACNGTGGNKIITKAYIFERKTLPGNKLLVSYKYQKGTALVNDSSIVDNNILPQDSIPVTMLENSSTGTPANP
ncbi:MAG TPA: hypothetical protein VHB48_19110 [Chitinophagaceae bacterium]|nr:hypothetical protein [Chitinophagaceae bacterium]